MKNLEILWLDDQRDPIKYFKKKPDESNVTLTRNFNFYNNLFKQYNVNFTWVKSYDEFVNFITTNGVPKLISFDYDLKNGRMNVEGKLPTGMDCAKWLMEYCKENGVSMPKCYVHSANKKHTPELNSFLGLSENKKTLKITESKLRELVTECVKNTLKEYFKN